MCGRDVSFLFCILKGNNFRRFFKLYMDEMEANKQMLLVKQLGLTVHLISNVCCHSITVLTCVFVCVYVSVHVYMYMLNVYIYMRVISQFL